MHIFRVLPVLTLLLGARASPVESSDEASNRLDVRADISQICYPASLGGVIPGVDSQTCGSTFHFRLMPECVSERSAVCICYPYTGALVTLISNGGLVTTANLIALGVSDRFKLYNGRASD